MAVTRRRFLQTSAAALALPAFVPSRSKGANERLTLGVIGCGGRGRWLTDAFLKQPEVQIVAVADVDTARGNLGREPVKAMVDAKSPGCRAFTDYRDLLQVDGLDAVVIATPDHWHALCAIAAARAGKHTYCEKPLTNSIPEGRAVVDAVEKAGVVFQTGSHERSTASIRFACERVRNGFLGNLRQVTVNLPCSDNHHQDARSITSVPAPEPVPDGLDYDFWLGHTPLEPYTPRRCHFWWRFVLAYGGGEMTDRGAHVLDIAQLGAGKDESGPLRVEAEGVQTPGSLYDTWWDYNFTFEYADGLRFVGTTDGPRGLKFEGDQGWIFVHIHGGKLEAEPANLLDEQAEPGPISLGRSPGHQRNFVDAVRSGAEVMAPVGAAHRTATLCHLANLAMGLGRPVLWDPERERILGDAAADGMLMPSMRPPWTLG